MKANRLFTKKKVLKMSPRDVLTADGRKNSKEAAADTAVAAAAADMAAADTAVAAAADTAAAKEAAVAAKKW